MKVYTQIKDGVLSIDSRDMPMAMVLTQTDLAQLKAMPIKPDRDAVYSFYKGPIDVPVPQAIEWLKAHVPEARAK